jgi:ATP-binding cassette subfamily B (MDR/TAP) protein 9
MLILDGQMKGGELVSFMLYQVSLSDSINQIGWVYTAFMEALGAADKVFELVDRKPKVRRACTQCVYGLCVT